jgi:hypothetical protein
MSAAFPCGGIHPTHHIHHMPAARIADARTGARKTRRQARIFGHPKSPPHRGAPLPSESQPGTAGVAFWRKRDTLLYGADPAELCVATRQPDVFLLSPGANGANGANAPPSSL